MNESKKEKKKKKKTNKKKRRKKIHEKMQRMERGFLCVKFKGFTFTTLPWRRRFCRCLVKKEKREKMRKIRKCCYKHHHFFIILFFTSKAFNVVMCWFQLHDAGNLIYIKPHCLMKGMSKMESRKFFTAASKSKFCLLKRNLIS